MTETKLANIWSLFCPDLSLCHSVKPNLTFEFVNKTLICFISALMRYITKALFKQLNVAWDFILICVSVAVKLNQLYIGCTNLHWLWPRHPMIGCKWDSLRPSCCRNFNGRVGGARGGLGGRLWALLGLFTSASSSLSCPSHHFLIHHILGGTSLRHILPIRNDRETPGKEQKHYFVIANLSSGGKEKHAPLQCHSSHSSSTSHYVVKNVKTSLKYHH